MREDGDCSYSCMHLIVIGIGFNEILGHQSHKTSARAKLARCIRELGGYESGVVEAGCLRLKKNVLTSKGPVHSSASYST